MGWDEDYRTRGALWGGAAGTLPDLPPRSRVLETGCGNGKTLAAMTAAGWTAVGVDSSPHAVRLAASCEPPVILGDICALPFPDNSFDAVFCWHVLGHLSGAEIPAAAREMYRVLRPCGTIFCKVFSRNDMRYGKGRETEKHSFLRGDGVVTHYFDTAELQDVFGEGTLTVSAWNMRIRGTMYHREELCGVFRRDCNGSDRW